MIDVIHSDDRGSTDAGWLDSKQTFSFGGYRNPRRMGFGALRVINEDRVQPGQGFGTHGHQDMEILSYVITGALEHKDSMGNGSVIRPGDLQRMSAGTGVMHSEYNASDSEQVHFLQIWLLPERQRLAPGYEQKTFSAGDKRGRLKLIGSRDGRDGSVTIHQHVGLYATLLEHGESVTHEFEPGRKGFVHIVRGAAALDGQPLAAGDGVAVIGERVRMAARKNTEILLFDLG